MSKFRLCAFADEADSDIRGQIKALNRNGVGLIEVRGINGKNISDMTLLEVKEANKLYNDNGIKVWSIGSPIGKININDDFEADLEKFKRTLDTAVEMNAQCIRMFSFYGTNGEAKYRDEVMEKLSRYAEIAQGSSVVLCHENEKGIYGDVASRCYDIVTSIPGIKAVFDPANFNQCDQNILDAWNLLKQYVYYHHIKDADLDHKIVPAGYGSTNMKVYLTEYAKMGGGVLTAEPHLADFVGLSNLANEDETANIGSFKFDSNDESFDFAINAIKNLIKDI